MRRIRVIPALLMENGGLVKTTTFSNPKYVGDPINTVKIFNEKEVDEIVLLDIGASKKSTPPDIHKISEIADECFMPLAYGGGITVLSQIKDIFSAGVEKVILNTGFFTHPDLIQKAVDIYGTQSIVVSLDIQKRRLFGGYQVKSQSGKRKQTASPVDAALQAVEKGAGELLITSIDNDGLMTGYDIDLIRSIAELVPVPVIACGGAGSVDDFVTAINDGKASAVAAGSLFVFKGPHRAVLVNYPDQKTLIEKFYSQL